MFEDMLVFCSVLFQAVRGIIKLSPINVTGMDCPGLAAAGMGDPCSRIAVVMIVLFHSCSDRLFACIPFTECLEALRDLHASTFVFLVGVSIAVRHGARRRGGVWKLLVRGSALFALGSRDGSPWCCYRRRSYFDPAPIFTSPARPRIPRFRRSLILDRYFHLRAVLPVHGPIWNLPLVHPPNCQHGLRTALPWFASCSSDLDRFVPYPGGRESIISDAARPAALLVCSPNSLSCTCPRC